MFIFEQHDTKHIKVKNIGRKKINIFLNYITFTKTVHKVKINDAKRHPISLRSVTVKPPTSSFAYGMKSWAVQYTNKVE